MAHLQNTYGAAHSTDAYGNVIRKDEYGNVIPTDEHGNPIRHSSTTLQGGQQQQRHDLSTEYDGQGGGRNKGLREKITENIPGVGNNDHRNHTSSATTDAYGNVIRKDEYGNVIPTDEHGNPIRYSGTTLQGGQQQQQQRHAEYDGQGGGRNKGLKEKITENIPGVGNNDHRNHTSSATTDAYGNVIRKDEYGNVIPTDEHGNPIRHSGTTLQGGQQQQQQQQRHDLSTEFDGKGGGRNKGLKEKLTENIPGVGNNDHRNHTSSATTDAYGNVIRKDEYGNVIPTDEHGNPIRDSGTTLQGGQQQQQRHDLSTEFDGQDGGRNKGLKEKLTENIPGVGNNDHRNHTSSATTDAYGNVIRKDEYGNVIPTDEHGNPIRHSGTTLQGRQQQQQRHDLSTEYDGQDGGRNKGLREKITENIPGVGNNDHRNHTSSATTDAYGNVIRKDEYGNVIPTDEHGNPIRHSGTTLQGGQQQQQQRHDLSTEYDGQGGGRNKGLKEKLTENIPGVGNNDHRNDTSSATTDAYGNVIRKDEYGNVIPTDEHGNPIRHSGTTLQGGQQQRQQRHDLSTEFDGQGGGRNKGLKEKITENIPGVGINDRRNDTSSATTDEYGNVIRKDEYSNVIRKDEYGNVIPTDEHGNLKRHSGTTLQGGQQQQRHDLSTEYDGQGRGRRNKVGEAAHSRDAYGNVNRTDKYGNVIPAYDYGNPIRHSDTTLQGVQQQQRHNLSTEYDGQGRGRRNKVGEAAHSRDAYGNVIPAYDYGNPIRHSDTTLQGVQQQQRHNLSASTDEYGNVVRADEYGNVIRTDEYGNPIRISGGGHMDHRSDTSYATATTYPTTAGYGTGEQPQHRHHRGLIETIKDKLSGTSYDQHNEYY
ncbi:mesocentin-like isoform X4 [Juglans microcarpa x Juglans regia]|uniref:mesocentin-like isoform X4 n=1 Tax=Juglans microcarpa x Juglans regia TaxID=2249226 RepID=UPI001B7F2467|nr:mesocentin-like isoform X4 [Juglans microcarpa x Juglans regia]